MLLAVNILATGIFGSYQTAQAAEFTAGAIAAGESLEWISTILASTGLAISVKELLKPRQAEIEKDIGKNIDWDNVDFGDLLDSPAAQDQINDAEDMINRLYGNASAKWKEMYEKSLSPTPTPETSPDNPEPSPPVTVAPIDPDTVTPPDWDILKKTSMNNGYLALGTATYWCLKEAVSNWWDKVFQEDPSTTYAGNPYDYKDLIGSYSVTFNCTQLGGFKGTYTSYFYDTKGKISHLNVKEDNSSSQLIHYIQSDSSSLTFSYYYVHRHDYYSKDPYVGTGKSSGTVCKESPPSLSSDYVESINLYVPYTMDGIDYNAKIKPMGKIGIWPSTDLKNDYNSNKSPSIPDSSPAPAIKIPSLDEIKDLQKKGNDSDDEKRPSIIQEFVTNHYTNPTPAPEPTTAPDPNPTTAPDPDPNPSESPDPTTTPAVNPEISGAPKPSSPPDNPDDTDTDTDINLDNYKTDLRLVFPFCIPFDLVHLIQAFEAEPKAPVFEFPVDMELTNPFTEKKILDYHHTFELDMSDFEPVIKILRIFEIIFFIIGLLMITRQQMIKG